MQLRMRCQPIIESAHLSVDLPIGLGRPKPMSEKSKEVAERVGFEPTCRNYPTIRFRVGAVMTTSVPLRLIIYHLHVT
jgi:hypothetical protein